MSEARRLRRAKQVEARAAHRTAKGISPASAGGMATGSPLSMGRALFSGRALWVTLALIASTLFLYAQVWHHSFVNYDDPEYVIANAHVLRGLTWQNVWWAFTTGEGGYWRPLAWLGYMLDMQLYGMNPGPHHLTNVILHIANAILLFGLLHRMTGALGRSAFVAALFAVHPLHVESVAWVVELNDVLSTLFWVLTLWGYIEYRRRPGLGRYLLMLLFFAFGLMVKPMLVTLPFLLVLLDFWPLGRVRLAWDQSTAWLRLVWEKLPLFALSFAASIVSIVVQRQMGNAPTLTALPLDRRVAGAMLSYMAYIGKTLWPTRLAVYYPYFPSLPGWRVAASVLVLIVVSVVAIRASRRFPYLLVGWLWYLGTLVPVIGLVQSGSQSIADHFTYVPIIGLFLIASWGVAEVSTRWPFRALVLGTAASVVILACMIAAQAQVRHWKDSTALWEHTLAVTTDNDIAHLHLGVILSDQGRESEAIAHYREALRIRPTFTQAHNDLAISLAGQGKTDEAITHYSEALRLKPDFADAHNNLGAALADQGKIDQAIHEILEALRINPNQADWHDNAAELLAQQGRLEEAARHFEAALKIDPSNRRARSGLDDLKGKLK